MITWAGDVEVNLPDDVTTEEEFMNYVRSFNLREQLLRIKSLPPDYDRYTIDTFYFDKIGRIYFVGGYEEIGEA
jgi:hypothetical protein